MTDLHELARRLREISNAIAKGDRSELTMRVPAEPKRDADLVTAAAADLIESMAKAEKHSVIEEIAAERKKMTSSVPEYDFTEGAASHFCRICGAWWLCSSDGTWQLRSERAGEDCCDNTPMHGNPHIVSVRAALQAIDNIASVPAAPTAEQAAPQEPVAWILTDEKINDISSPHGSNRKRPHGAGSPSR